MFSSEEKLVIQVVQEVFPGSGVEITPETKLIDDLGLDSLDFIDVITGLESKFGVEIPDHIAVAMVTVGDAAEKIQALLW